MAAGAGSVSIYALCDPDTNAIRYVGKANDVSARIKSHRHEANSCKIHTRKANWIRSLCNREPSVMILAVVPKDSWEESERYWIGEMRRRGCDLTNFSDGGQTSPVEGKGHTEEVKQKMRDAAIRNRSKPPSRSGTKTSEETKQKLRIASAIRNVRPPSTGGWNKGIRRTHCKNGHEYNPETTRLYHRSDRNRSHQICLICERTITARHLAKKRSMA